MPTLDLVTATDLTSILKVRGDSMLACGVNDWLFDLIDIPGNAAKPLAMSGPHPRAVGSYGAECIAWAKEQFGVELRWWQKLAVTRQLEHDIDGNLVWRKIIETGPRRIGKSVRLRIVALWRIANAERIGEKQIAMLVSKDLAVGKEIHRGAWHWAERQGWKVTRLNGGQEVEAPGENRWLLRADTAVYGYDVGYGQVDESWGVDPMSITDGLEPALMERFWPQLHLTSTAHVKATSLMRRRLVNALRATDQNTLLLMWAAHPDQDYADLSTWKAASPHWSADRLELIQERYNAALAGQIEPEMDDPDPIRGWASQYLNVWPRLFESGKSLWPNWENLATALPPGKPEALGVSSDVDGVWLSLGAASQVSGKPHLGSVQRMRSTEEAYFIEETKRIQTEQGCSVVLDVKGPAGYLIEKLEVAGVVVTRAGIDDYVQACTDLDVAIRAGAVGHGDYTVLNDAARSATWRKVGDRKVFGRKDGDISMLEACAWAKWALDRPAVEWEPMVAYA